LRFDGRVAVVTGAGRGIGRAYALLLASRGARVVVNDHGGSMEGVGSDSGPASSVVEEIVAAGGTAIADASDVSAEAGAQALIDTAVSTYGRIDVLINNAGIMRWAGMPDVDFENLAMHLGVHVGGSFNTVRAAWPHMTAQDYGRIVMTTSSGLFGLPKNTSYAAAKGAVIGLTRSLATAGAKHGVAVNAIAPAAATRMGGDTETAEMSPELVAPMAAYLAHEECPVTGEIYAAGAGRFARLFIASAPGYVSSAPTVEDVAEHWDTINDATGYYVPTDLTDWSVHFLAHLRTDEPPTMPTRSTDEEDSGWGEREDDEDRDDIRRLEAEKPPHHRE
jgi:NAD(P)-dependent dehydrogenase (short-subunit alcohol dehydrogenase family)